MFFFFVFFICSWVNQKKSRTAAKPNDVWRPLADTLYTIADDLHGDFKHIVYEHRQSTRVHSVLHVHIVKLKREDLMY